MTFLGNQWDLCGKNLATTRDGEGRGPTEEDEQAQCHLAVSSRRAMGNVTWLYFSRIMGNGKWAVAKVMGMVIISCTTGRRNNYRQKIKGVLTHYNHWLWWAVWCWLGTALILLNQSRFFQAAQGCSVCSRGEPIHSKCRCGTEQFFPIMTLQWCFITNEVVRVHHGLATQRRHLPAINGFFVHPTIFPKVYYKF